MTPEYEVAVKVLFPQYFLEKTRNIFMYVTHVAFYAYFGHTFLGFSLSYHLCRKFCFKE